MLGTQSDASIVRSSLGVEMAEVDDYRALVASAFTRDVVAWSPDDTTEPASRDEYALAAMLGDSLGIDSSEVQHKARRLQGPDFVPRVRS